MAIGIVFGINSIAAVVVWVFRDQATPYYLEGWTAYTIWHIGSTWALLIVATLGTIILVTWSFSGDTDDREEGNLTPGQVRMIQLVGIVTFGGLGTLCGVYLYSCTSRISQFVDLTTRFSTILKRVPDGMGGHGTWPSNLLPDVARNVLIVEKSWVGNTGRHYSPSPDDTIPGYHAPKSPEDVRFLLTVTKDAQSVRSYTPSGSSDYQRVLHVRLLSWPGEDVLMTNSFKGGIPLNRSGAPAGAPLKIYGSEPWGEIADWLKNAKPSGK